MRMEGNTKEEEEDAKLRGRERNMLCLSSLRFFFFFFLGKIIFRPKIEGCMLSAILIEFLSLLGSVYQTLLTEC